MQISARTENAASQRTFLLAGCVMIQTAERDCLPRRSRLSVLQNMLAALLDRLEANEKAGIVYHREGIMGDYDEFDDVEALIEFIKTGKRQNLTP